jgi:hypothetical protein
MKFIAYNIIFLVFASLGSMANIESESTDDFTTEKVNCEAYCPDFDVDVLETACSNTCLENTFVVYDKEEEEYVDDIPFDTSEVFENFKSMDENKQEEEVTIFKLFIKWISLLFQID